MKRLLASLREPVELRHAVDHDGVEGVGDAEIVAGAERLFAEVGEGEAGGAHRGERDADLAAEALDVGGRAGLAAGEAEPEGVHLGLHRRAGAEVIDLLALELQPPVVGRAVERGRSRRAP